MERWSDSGVQLRCARRLDVCARFEKLLELPAEHRRFFCAYKNYS
jgi:hypothetical protein